MDDQKQNQEQNAPQDQQDMNQPVSDQPALDHPASDHPVPKKKKKRPSFEDERQRELRELIELKKMKQAAAEHREVNYEIPKEEKIVPKTFKEKWKNYWYHYKATTWFTVIAVVMVAWLVKDIFFGPEYDLTVTTATRYNFSALNDGLQDYMGRYVTEDYNGDGEMNLLYSEITVDFSADSSADPQMNAINAQTLMAVLAGGDDLLFIMDQDAYDMLVQSSGEGIFVDFTEMYGFLGEEIVQGDKIYIQDTTLGREMYLDRLEGEVFICLRDMGGTADASDEDTQRTRQASLDFIDNLLRENYPEAFEGR